MSYELPQFQDRAIWDIWLSAYQLPTMAVADELGILQALAGESSTPAEIAQRLCLNRRATEVLFSMLRALGLLVLREGRHELAGVARTYLLPESPYYWGHLLRTLGVLPQQHAALTRALRTADNLAGTMSGRLPSHAWVAGKMERAQAEAVSRIMHCHSLPAAVGAAQSGKFDSVARLLDVGGGSGCFSIAIAQRIPEIRCTVMELPAVCDVARGYIDESGVADRVDTTSVDMFREDWPNGYDGIFLSNVFHDWSFETNLLLARRAYAALPAGGRILLHEMLLAADGCGPVTTAAFSILMLLGTQGHQYSLSELQHILADAGFIDIGADASYGYYSIVSGRKPWVESAPLVRRAN
jgi:acetylserotonin N-methyltransferase